MDPIWLDYASNAYSKKWKAHQHNNIGQNLSRTKPNRPATKENRNFAWLDSRFGVTNETSMNALGSGEKRQAALQNECLAIAVAFSAVNAECSPNTAIDANPISSFPLGHQSDPPQSAQRSVDEKCMKQIESHYDQTARGSSQISVEPVNAAFINNSPPTSYFCHASQETEEAMQLLAEQTGSNDDIILTEGHELSDELFDDTAMEDDLPDWLSAIQTSNIRSASPIHTGNETLPGHTATSSPLASQSSCILKHVCGIARVTKPTEIVEVEQSENEYLDSDFETSFMELAASHEHEPSTPQISPQGSTTPKLRRLLPKIMMPKKMTPMKSPRFPVTSEVPYKIQFGLKGEPIPFLRSPFPTPILDRSPILGLTNRTVLRVCFRIGEALNAACQASRNYTDAIIELYARVIESSREGYKQIFSFADLFTDNPPYLKGVYGMWKGVGLWDQDSAVFIGVQGQGKMCRVLGRIKREKGKAYEMNVLSIWGCGWEDVGIAKGATTS